MVACWMGVVRGVGSADQVNVAAPPWSSPTQRNHAELAWFLPGREAGAGHLTAAIPAPRGWRASHGRPVRGGRGFPGPTSGHGVLAQRLPGAAVPGAAASRQRSPQVRVRGAGAREKPAGRHAGLIAACGRVIPCGCGPGRGSTARRVTGGGGRGWRRRSRRGLGEARCGRWPSAGSRRGPGSGARARRAAGARPAGPRWSRSRSRGR